MMPLSGVQVSKANDSVDRLYLFRPATLLRSRSKDLLPQRTLWCARLHSVFRAFIDTASTWSYYWVVLVLSVLAERQNLLCTRYRGVPTMRTSDMHEISPWMPGKAAMIGVTSHDKATRPANHTPTHHSRPHSIRKDSQSGHTSS